MKLLIVEDDQTKLFHLRQFIASEYGEDIDIATSYTSAINKLLEARYDMVLLDMTLPTFDANSSQLPSDVRHFAGKEILRKMKRQKIFTPVVIVTGFSTFGEGYEKMDLNVLCEELRRDYPDIYIGAVSYSAAYTNWQSEIKAFIDTKMEI